MACSSLDLIMKADMKTNRSILVCMTVAVVFGGSVASVKADDIFPPPWHEGHARYNLPGLDFHDRCQPLAAGRGLLQPLWDAIGND